MNKHLKFTFVIAVAVIVTSVVTAYFATKNTRAAYVSAAYDMEAFNDLHRIESWDSLERLLVRGCSKEALEYVKMEQSLALSSLKQHLDNGAMLEKKIQEEKDSIIKRAKSFAGQVTYDIPTCK